jgi:hypothetical protein
LPFANSAKEEIMLIARKKLRVPTQSIRTDALHRYFGVVIAHDRADPSRPDAAFCYCGVPSGRFRYRDTVVVTDLPEPGPCFFDDQGGVRSQRWVEDPRLGEWVRIVVADGSSLEIAGFYNPATHTLVATDWVHDERSAAAIHHIAAVMGWQQKRGLEDPPGEILLGADPEWEAWDPRCREVVRPDPHEDCFSCDEYGEVGIDGSGDVPEARPKPTSDPAELYWRIKMLALEWEHRTKKRVCLAGHQYPIGAHIHVGAEDGYQLEGPFQKFVDAVDSRVGFLLNLSGDARGEYRQRRAWRLQSYGLEYRTLPSAVLALEDLAIWAIRVIHAIAKGENPPEQDQKIRDSFHAVLRAVKSKRPFSFELENLEEAAARPELILRDEWAREWQAWASELNSSGRVLRDALLFGFAENRGDVTNDDAIAQAQGWGLIAYEHPSSIRPAIGLPRSVRVAWDANMACLIEARLIQLGVLRPRD